MNKLVNLTPHDIAITGYGVIEPSGYSVKVLATRVDFKDRIELGKEDSGRNLPHGVYVDNLGLNGLLIVEGETERSFTLRAPRWVPESSRWIFLRAKQDGGQASQPVLLHVKR